MQQFSNTVSQKWIIEELPLLKRYSRKDSDSGRLKIIILGRLCNRVVIILLIQYIVYALCIQYIHVKCYRQSRALRHRGVGGLTPLLHRPDTQSILFGGGIITLLSKDIE